MNFVTRYLAEEIAEDHAAGQLTRREALRRLGLMGFSAMASSGLLAACGGSKGVDDAITQPVTTAGGSGSATTAAGGSQPATSTPRAVAPTDITYPGQGSLMLRGVFAAASPAKGAVMVIHENTGVTAFTRAMVGRLAADGFTALAVDLVSREGGTAAFADSGAISAALNRLQEDSVADMRSTLDELGRRQPGAKLGMCGFCYGGTQTWRLLEAGEPRLRAAIPCYGTPSDSPVLAGSRSAAVLGIYAATDNRVNATRVAAESALDRDRLTFELKTFPGVGHGFIRFFEDTASASHEQAKLAYQAMLDWFGKHLV